MDIHHDILRDDVSSVTSVSAARRSSTLTIFERGWWIQGYRVVYDDDDDDDDDDEEKDEDIGEEGIKEFLKSHE